MGNGPSQQSVRSSHFQRPGGDAPQDPYFDEDDFDQNRISISNKMVERLVEDATIASGAAPKTSVLTPHGDYKDKIYTEKLKAMDDKHSKKYGLTIDDLNATVSRIEKRTEKLVPREPVCADCIGKVIECYAKAERHGDFNKCGVAVDAFSRCVADTAARRLHAKAQADARECARRERHVAHAKQNVLKDLGTPVDVEANVKRTIEY